MVSPITVAPPTFEHHHDGIGIDTARPRISWKFLCANESVSDWKQTAYELEVGTWEDVVAHREDIPTFSEGNAPSSSLLPWPSDCSSLTSRARRLVRVRCFGTYRYDGGLREGWTEWSSRSQVEAGLLDRDDWQAQMITIADPLPLNDDGSLKPLRFRTVFDIAADVRIVWARLYATSHGIYHPTLNGRAVGDHCMAPGWQSYHKRLHYQIYEPTTQMQRGKNVLDVDVGAGWFASALTSNNYRFYYGRELGLLAQLEVTIQHEDGSTEVITVCTDASWTCESSPITSSEIYNGETYDQRRAEQLDGTFHPLQYKTKISPIPVAELISPSAPPVRVTETISPVAILQSPSGATILDFGQNLVGRLRIPSLHKSAGTRITFRHAEVLEDGELCVRPLRNAAQTDTIIFSGKSILVHWTPKFTFHGFRYVAVSGWSPSDTLQPLTTTSVVAEVLHTDMPRTGDFTCSNAELNQLHHNALWSMRGNFVSVPSDCPARDDREGWTGDLAIFIPTATFLYDVAGTLRNWLHDLSADQFSTSSTWTPGVVPLVVPNCFEKHPADAAAGPYGKGWDPLPNGIWGDAAILVPWHLYLATRDPEILAAQYASMTAFLSDGVRRDADGSGLWDPNQWQFGDWLDPNAPTNSSDQTSTDGTFVADCFLLRSTRLMARIARVLRKHDDAERYRDEYARLRAAWRDRYLSPAGLLVPDTPTALALALDLRLLPRSVVRTCRERLRRRLRLMDFRVPTGFAGTASLLGALAGGGREGEMPGLAFTVLMQERATPGFLSGVRMGATTIWERWDALRREEVGRVKVCEGGMTSFNHYALGACVGWLQGCVGGVRLVGADDDADDEDGDEVAASGTEAMVRFRIQPLVHHALRWAESRLDSRWGDVSSRWEFVDDAPTTATAAAAADPSSSTTSTVHVRVSVPPNTRARVTLPHITSWRTGRATHETPAEGRPLVVGSG
ncbi:MAG: family 78 glycoside hydrolase catalytic domain, partial [Terriglobus roseus]|nr:family 78 glycoside hydrolase catalytic domain [Terriglobus roseus]